VGGLRVLILGGTAEARALAAALTELPDVQPISSLAGRVAEPVLPAGEVRIGGFGGEAGLADWLTSERIAAVIDATHPFAARISRSAAGAASASGVPILALRRPGWVEEPGRGWQRVPSLSAAAAALRGLGERVLLTTGRTDLAPFAPLDEHWFLIRSIDPPSPPLPARHQILLARGPFSVPDEVALMLDHRIAVLVTKDSGGPLTEAKLTAAGQLGLPVVLVDRPAFPEIETVKTVEAAVQWVVALAIAQQSAQPG
jgi:precorrin-6A/cobalt-precorrin-6A reductase